MAHSTGDDMPTSMRTILLIGILALAAGCAPGSGGDKLPSPEEATLTTVGDPAPTFAVQTLDGDTFDLAEQKGKIVLINWFATWCPPCQEEMPHLEKEVWHRFKGPNFAMVSVAREEEADVVTPFVTKYGVTWPFALDPDRAAFAKYAEAYIPRNTVVNREGRIIFQSQGFEEKDFEAMIEGFGECEDLAAIVVDLGLAQK